VAMRMLEKRYLKQERWPELIALYEHMGLTASDASFAASVHLDRARLRRRVQAPGLAPADLDAAVDSDYRLALQREPHLRSALREPEQRARAYLLAGAIAQDRLADKPRAAGDLRHALVASPMGALSGEAFERLERVLADLGDHASMAELYAERLRVETDGARL